MMFRLLLSFVIFSHQHLFCYAQATTDEPIVIGKTATVPFIHGSVIDHDVVTSRPVQLKVRFYCSQKECMQCVGAGCPLDIALYDGIDDCAGNCPPEPDCYYCDGTNCGPAYGLACFANDDGRYSTFHEQDTCAQYCPVEIRCGQVEHEVYDDCGSACPATCDDRGRATCATKCIPGCYCVNGYYRETLSGKCVKVDMCPATNKTWYCDKFDTVFCLITLSEIPDIVPDLNMVKLLKLGLEKNKDKQKKICDLFDEYYECARGVAEDKSCVVNGSLDRLANTSASFLCDQEMYEMARENEDCLNKLGKNRELKNCSKELGPVMNLQRLDELAGGDDDKACEVLKVLQEYHPCQRKVMKEVCEPSALKLEDYFEEKVERLFKENGCDGKGYGKPKAVECGTIAGPANREPHLLATAGCSEAEMMHVETCFLPYYCIKNESLKVFDGGALKLAKNMEKLILKNCDRYESQFKPCIYETASAAGSCKVYSCTAQSIITGCLEKDNLKKHWSCIFALMVEEDVLICLEKIGITLGENKGVDWTVVVPKLLRCVDKHVRATCDNSTMDFLNALAVPLTGKPDNGECPIDTKLLDRYGEAPGETAAPEPSHVPTVHATIPTPSVTDEVIVADSTPRTTPMIHVSKTTPSKKPEPFTFQARDDVTTKAAGYACCSNLSIFISLTCLFYMLKSSYVAV